MATSFLISIVALGSLTAAAVAVGNRAPDFTSTEQAPQLAPDPRPAPSPASLPVPHFDIKPGECPNTFDIHSTSALVAGFGSSLLGNAFDVTQVSLDSVRLTRPVAFLDDELVDEAFWPVIYPTSMRFIDDGTPYHGGVPCGCHTRNGDGKIDLHMEFDLLELIQAFQLEGTPHRTVMQLELRFTSGGHNYRARDCIKVLNN